MDELTFYYCVQILLDRMGYMSHIPPAGVKAESEQEAKARSVVDWGIRAAEAVFGIDIPLHLEPISLPLDDLNPEELNSLKQDWEKFRADFPVAGLRYVQGLPVVFFAKVGDFLFSTENDLSFYYEKLHKSSDDFFSNHSIGMTRYGSGRFTFCLAFTDSESLDVAKAFLQQGGYNPHIFRQFVVEIWLLDLNTLDLITPKGILPSIGEATEAACRMVKDIVTTSGKADSLKNWNPPKGFLIAPLLFTEFVKLFNLAVHRGELPIPEEWQNEFKTERLRIQHLSLENQLEKKKGEIEECEKMLGEEIFSRYETGITFETLGELLDKNSRKKRLIETFHKKLELLAGLRQEWTSSQNRCKSLEEEKSEIEKQFAKVCSQLAEAVFQYGQMLIDVDPALRQAFAEPRRLQEQIKTREKEIFELEKLKADFFASIKSNAKILYLKALNLNDQRQKKKCWYQVGLKVIENTPDFSHSNEIAPIWENQKKIQLKQEKIEDALHQESENQRIIIESIKDLSESHIEGQFPWNELEEKFYENIRQLESDLRELLLNIGRTFRATGGKPVEGEKRLLKRLQYLEEQKNKIILDIERVVHQKENV